MATNSNEMQQDSNRYIRMFGPSVSDSRPVTIEELGGKGINLCELTTAGFAVPPGFVVTTAAYNLFVTKHGLNTKIESIIDRLDVEDTKSLDHASSSIRNLFGDEEVPQELVDTILESYKVLKDSNNAHVAVRSSATAEDLPDASFAGQQDTYLNISGDDHVVKSVLRCWASLWTSRAIVYRKQQNIPMEGLALAVVVQGMVQAEIAGIMFTANPLTGARDEVMINASWGLGESIVGGHVTPDTVISEKDSGKVITINIAEKTVMTARTADGTEEIDIPADLRSKRVLDDEMVVKLTAVAKNIETHYGSPQDIEWALLDGECHIVQSRPVTKLPADPAVGKKVLESEKAKLADIAKNGKGRAVWVRHNLDEILRSPTPLTWDIVKDFMSGDGGFGLMYRDLGYKPSEEVAKDGFLDLICGRIYADPSRAADLFWDGMPLSYDLDEVVADPHQMDAAPSNFDAERADGKFLISLPRLVRDMLRCSKGMKKTAETVVEKFRDEVVPKFDKWLEVKLAQDLTKLSTKELLVELDERIEEGFNQIGRESLKPGFFGGIAEAALEARFATLMGEEKGRTLALILTQGLEGDTTVEQNAMLFHVARDNGTQEDFIAKYGYRAVGEMELANDRWWEDDSYIEKIITAYKGDEVKSPAVLHELNAEQRKETESGLMETLREWGGSAYYEDVVVDMKEAQKMLPYREIGKDYLIMGYDIIRRALTELGRRWRIEGDVFFLHLSELAEYEDATEKFAGLIKQRKEEWAAAKELDMPEVVDTDDLERLGVPVEYDDEDVLKGDPVAAGVADGPARIVFDPNDAASSNTNYVLVCPSTDPGWTALFVHACAVIVEQGGVLSHGAIVARDFGIPAVVCPDATRRIPDGAMIRVDGNRGVITIIDEEKGQE